MKPAWLPNFLLGSAMVAAAIGALFIARSKHYELSIRSDGGAFEFPIYSLAYSTDSQEKRREMADYAIHRTREIIELRTQASRARGMIIPLLGFGILTMSYSLVCRKKGGNKNRRPDGA